MIATVPPTTIYAQPILGALHSLLSTSIAKIIDPPTGSMMQQSLTAIAGEQLMTWTFGNLSASLANDAYVSMVSPALAYKCVQVIVDGHGRTGNDHIGDVQESITM